MTTAAPIASHGTSAHLPAGLVVLHPARTASVRTVSARTVQGRSRAAHAPRPAQVAQPAHAPATSAQAPAQVRPVVSEVQAASDVQAPSAKSVLLAKGGRASALGSRFYSSSWYSARFLEGPASADFGGADCARCY